jgi:RNA methyltransferase, TrmH family
MPVRVVESKDNARLKELRKALAAAGRSAQGRVGVEGPHLLEEALHAGLRVRTVFVAQGAEKLLGALPVPPETEILRLPAKLLDSALATETPQPIAALVERPEWTWAHVLNVNPKKAALVVVLAGIQDPGNLGTILRSAEAFGATGVVSLPGTVSAWNPKAVRASAGSVFRVPLLAASERECLEKLREAGVKILATTVQGAQPADLVDMAGPVALIIGNEGNGVASDLAAKADGRVTIPCPGPVESLNAAVAASVLLYEAARQRASSIFHPFSASAGRAGERMGHGGLKRGARR